MSSPPDRARLLLVGGGGGLVGRALLAEFAGDRKIRSVHRHPAPAEDGRGVEWVRGNAAEISNWDPIVHEVDLVVNVAWYRAGSERRFAPLAGGLERLITAAEKARVRRFVQISVPPGPESLESSLPYFVHKRRVDRALEASGLSYAIVCPTMLFAPRDKLLTVMLGMMARYRRFPMFGYGRYHLSPLAASDLAKIVRRESDLPESHTVLAGGPRRWQYRALTDVMFERLGLPPRYVHLSPANSRRIARLLESVGSTRLYEYEVEWLLADLLGLEPYSGLGVPLSAVEPFLDSEAARLRR